MTGKPVRANRCPVCRRALEHGEATIPYVAKDNTVVVVKHVPAEICGDCRESFTSGKVTDQIVTILRQLQSLHSEVSVVSYVDYAMDHVNP